MVAELIHAGHEDAWSYTPRQMAGWLELEAARKKREALFDLELIATATQGSTKQIEAMRNRLKRET